MILTALADIEEPKLSKDYLFNHKCIQYFFSSMKPHVYKVRIRIRMRKSVKQDPKNRIILI